MSSNIILVGGFSPSEEYESFGMMTFPTEWKVMKTMFQTTNQLLQYQHRCQSPPNPLRQGSSAARSSAVPTAGYTLKLIEIG